MRSPWSHRLLRALQGAVAAGLAAVVGGVCVPFTLLDLGLLPSRGLANLGYVLVGGAAGLVAGALGAARTLRGGALLPRGYVALVAVMAAALAAAAIAARYFGAFAHV